MKEYSVFDLIGPRMIGPSSSHTAGAAKIGKIAYQIAGKVVTKAKITLYGSFADTGRGHGTDKAIVGGLLGYAPDDDRICQSIELAAQAGKDIQIIWAKEEAEHPNTVKINVERCNGKPFELIGVSVGGGNIEIRQINGMEVSFHCDYPTLLIFHRDRPGVIALVASRLAEAHINIAFMKVFRHSKKEDACMVIETDEEIPQTLMENIQKVSAEIMEVCSI